MINVRSVEAGTRLELADGAVVEVVSNPRDGIWVFGRYVSSPRDPALVGTEEMIFAQDVVAVWETS